MSFQQTTSVQIKIKFMFTLTVTSLERAVLCDDICATNQHVVQMTHYKICNHFLARKNTGAWRVVLPENLWNMSNKQKYELKIKNKIFFFFNFIIKARQGFQVPPANFWGAQILATNTGEFAVPGR